MVMGYGFLLASILLEIFSTQMMKASLGFTKILPTVLCAAGFCACFFALSKALLTVPLGVAYAIWSGLGTALTATLAVLVWKEPFSLTFALGVALIIGGCALLNLKS